MNKPNMLQERQEQQHQEQTDRQNPLEIPELLSLVGQYLSHYSLTFCIRVSQSWYRTLSPLIWLDIERESIVRFQWFEIGRMEYESDIPLSTLISKAPIIRKLTLVGPWSEIELAPITFPNLRDLTLPSIQEPNPLFLQRYQQQLTTLTIKLKAPITEQLLKALTGSVRLKKLVVHNLDIASSEAWMVLYERVWSNLSVLQTFGPWFSCQGTTVFSKELAATIQPRSETRGGGGGGSDSMSKIRELPFPAHISTTLPRP